MIDRTRYRVVMFYGDELNDYTEHVKVGQASAHLMLCGCGYTYSTTIGTERVYYNTQGYMGSMIQEDTNA